MTDSIPSSQRQWRLKAKTGYEQLVCESASVDKPTGTQVLVEMKAASLNYRDTAIIVDKYPGESKDSLIPLSDGAGIVSAIGPDVVRFKVGDRVMPNCLPNLIAGDPSPTTRAGSIGNVEDGVLREYMIVQQEGLVAMPTNLDYAQASTLPCAALTAWNALFGLASKALRPGDWVLCQGTGGTSLFAVQFAKAAGARIVCTTSSDDKGKLLKEKFGVDHVVNYRTDPEWGMSARKFTGDVGFDHVVDVGGSSTLGQSLKALRPQGVMSLIGFLGEGQGPALLEVLMTGVIVRGIGIGSRQQFEDMVRCIEANNIVPDVDSVFEFDDVHAAYHHLEKQSFVGKVVIKIGKD